MAFIGHEDDLFHMLNRKSAWEKGFFHRIAASEEGIGLAKTLQYVPERTITAGEFPAGMTLTGAAAGLCGMLYILDGPARAIYAYDVQEARYDRIDELRSLFRKPNRIAFAPGWIFISDQETEHIVFRFAEKYWQLVSTIGAAGPANETGPEPARPAGVQSMACDRFGRLTILDDVQGCVFQFDPNGRLIALFGQEELAGKQLAGLALAGGAVYVLVRSEKKVIEFTGGIQTAEFAVPLEAPSCLAADSRGFLYIGENRMLADGEEDRYIHKFSREGVRLEILSAYRGAADQVLFDECDRMYVINSAERRISVMRLAETLLKPAGTELASGLFVSASLDSVKPGTQWHKIAIDRIIPENARIEISYRVSDSKTVLLFGEERDLDEVLQDAMIPPDTKAQALEQLNDWNAEGWSEPLVNPQELLIRGGKGRYLWLKIKLSGTGSQSPFIRSVRCVFPRASYLDDLPAVYQEDENSRDFLERFLALFEHFFTHSEQTISRISAMFETDAASGDFLRWLASWLAVGYDENWPEPKLKQLIKQIPKLYRMRGTREGIERMIELFTGIRPIIVEQFQLKAAKDPEVKALLARLYGTDPYSFCVLLVPGQIRTDSEYRTVKKIVDDDKPAHTSAGVTVLQPCIYLDMHSYLEVNSFIAEPSSRIGDGVIGRDTLLGDPAEYGHAEGKSTVQLGTALA